MSKQNDFQKLRQKVQQQDNLIKQQSEKIKTLEEDNHRPVEDKKGGKFAQIAQHPLYIIVTIISVLLSAIGGIPGIIQIKEGIFDKPELMFYPTIKMIGSPTDSLTTIFMNGTISNVGKIPLSIKKVELYIVLNGIDYLTSPLPLPDTATFTGGRFKTAIIKGEEHNINKLRLLAENNPVKVNVFDYILMPKSKVVFDKKTLSFKLRCIDMKDRVFTYVFPYSEKDESDIQDNGFPSFDPQSGILLTPMTDSINARQH